VLAGVGMTRSSAQPNLNAVDFITGEIADGIEFMDHRIIDEHFVSESARHFGISM